MAERPYTVLSASVSLDGYLDAGGAERLVLSNPADLRRVDKVRAWADAILVGAGTVRNDDPRLLVRDRDLRRARVAAGRPESPTRVTLTGSGRLDPAGRFFTTGTGERLVYCGPTTPPDARRALAASATVVEVGAAGEQAVVPAVLEDLHRRGVRRLMVEGGGCVLTQVLTHDLADELHLALAPFFVGTSQGHRFVGDGRFPFHPGRRAVLADTLRLGDMVVLRYRLSERALAAAGRSIA